MWRVSTLFQLGVMPTGPLVWRKTRRILPGSDYPAAVVSAAEWQLLDLGHFGAGSSFNNMNRRPGRR